MKRGFKRGSHKKKGKSHKRRRTLRIQNKYKRVIGGNPSKIVIFSLNSDGGFFSNFWFLLNTYVYAKKNNYLFFIENNDWQYTYKNGWHDYFTTLNVYNNEHSDYPIERMSRASIIDSTHPRYTVSEYIEAIKEVYKLQPHLQEQITNKIKEYCTYTSVYIRRGDKSNEAKVMTSEEVIQSIGPENLEGQIFVQTDDYTAVEELGKLLPNSKILTTTLPSQRGSTNENMKNWSPEERKIDTEQFLISIGIFLGGVTCWTYFFSNVAQFHKLSSYDKVEVYVNSDTKIEDFAKILELNHCPEAIWSMFTNVQYK